MRKIALFGAILGVLGLNSAFGDQVSATKFKGLNNQANSVTIRPDEAQDLLNVDVSITGQSFKKRSGYGLYKALSTSKSTHGGYHAYDSSGNDYQLWGSSTSLYGIVADGTPIQLVSSATLNSTWDCADTQQNSYCVDSSRDAFIKTNGTTMQWYTTPLGTMVESTPDRIVVTGVSGSPNTLFVSQSNTFTNFTTGVNATDAFNEVIAAPGSKITHIRWGCQKLLWWKDQSFGYFDFDDQFSAQVKTISDIIGTFDNTSAIDPGGRVWFRGQDGHTWMYDCSILTKQSIEITPDVQVAAKRTTNLWTQTSQADFNAGISSQTFALNTSISPGDIVLSTNQFVDTLWNSGTLVQVDTTTMAPSVILSSFSIVSTPANQVQSTNCGTSCWRRADCTLNPDWVAQSFTTDGNAQQVTSVVLWLAKFNSGCDTTFRLKSDNSGPGSDVITASLSASSLSSSASPITFTLTPTSLNPNTKYWLYLDGCATNPGLNINGDAWFYNTGNPYANGQPKRQTEGGCSPPSDVDFEFQVNIQGVQSYQYFSTGSVTSRLFDITLTSNTFYGGATYYAYLQSTETDNGQSISYGYQTSTGTNGNGPYVWASSITVSTNTSFGPLTSRYFRYVAQLNSSNASLTPVLSTVTTNFKVSTGTYYSAVKNAPNLTSWSTLGINSANNGGAQTFYVRAGTNTFSTSSSTPTWTAATAGSLITVSTGTFMQFRDDFAITAATQTPTLNDFTLNWFEGTASDQAYMLYFDNAIWESVAFGVAQSTNNYVFKYDLINDGWTLYNFGAGGMLVQSNALYFGDTSLGNVFNYGTGTSDNGTAINAFWKSKDYTGNDPFLQNQLTNIDTFAKKNAGTTLTATYVMDTSTTTTYSISLTDPLRTIIQSRKLAPSGKLGQVFNIQYGDTSTSSAWEILGYRIGFIQLPYRPTSP